MKLPIVLGVVMLSASSTLWAQQAVNLQVPETTRSQIEGFEGSLRHAIDSAAQKLTDRVREAFPGVQIRLEYEAPPVVTGVMMPEAGAIFHVLIPAIGDVDLKMISLMAKRAAALPASPVRPTGVGATGVVDPDPMTPAAPPLTNPDQEYTTLMRASLIDAVLDHALSLPIPPGQYLTVIAGELQTQPASPFNPRSRMLILQLKGEDLIAFRENRISRDEARARIKESKY